MNIIELAIEKLKQLPQNAEINFLVSDLTGYITSKESLQSVILETTYVNGSQLNRQVKEVINEVFAQKKAESLLMEELSQAPNLEVLTQLLEKYPYDLNKNLDKKAIVAAIRKIDKDNAKIKEIALKQNQAKFDAIIPFDYAIRNTVVKLAAAQFAHPKPSAPQVAGAPKAKRQIPKKKLPELPPTQVVPPSKNKPDFTSPHAKITFPEKEMFMGSSGREASLVSLASYKKLRQLQIDEITKLGSESKRPKNRFFTPESHPEYKLKYPVFLGANGQMVAIMRVAPDDMQHKLGAGSFGTVFLGMDIDTGKIVAVKSQMPSKMYIGNDLAIKQGEIRAEFQTMEELGRLVSSIEINNEMISVDELAGTKDYLKMLEGGLRDNTSEEAKVLKLNMSQQFLEQIAEIHARGYLHCDVKIDNVMWDEKTKRAKPIDFGFAIPKPVPPTRFKSGNPGRGTPIYMSPEVLDGKFSVSSDVYACGVALIEQLSRYDIFTVDPPWSNYRESYRSSRDPAVFMEFFKNAAPDLFGPHPTPELLPIIEMIKKMIGPESKRPSLSAAIEVVKQQKALLEFQQFQEQLKSKQPLLIPTINLNNPKIKDFILEQCKINNESVLAKIEPSALYTLLREAAKTDNKMVFDNLVKRVGTRDQNGDWQPLFAQRNAGFAEDILRLMQDNQKKGKSHTLLKPYENAFSEAKKTWIRPAKSVPALVIPVTSIVSKASATPKAATTLETPKTPVPEMKVASRVQAFNVMTSPSSKKTSPPTKTFPATTATPLRPVPTNVVTTVQTTKVMTTFSSKTTKPVIKERSIVKQEGKTNILPEFKNVLEEKLRERQQNKHNKDVLKGKSGPKV